MVPGFHNRCELEHEIIRHLRRGNQRIREVIQVPDSIRKDTTFIVFLDSRGYLKFHWKLISATPNLGDLVICRYSGFTYHIFVWQYKSVILSPPIQGVPFGFQKEVSHAPIFIDVIPSYKPS